VSTTPLMQFKALLIPTLALVGFLTTTAGADVDLSQAPAFVYDATGPVPISVSQSEFSVQMVPTRGVDPAQRPTVLPQAVTPARLKPAAVDTELRIAQRGMHIVRDATLGDLRALPGAKSVLPIVYRSGSDMPMYPTEHVIVSYKTAPTDAELAELATRYQCEVERLDRGHNRVRFTIRDVAQVNPLALANLLHEDPATLYASDDFILPKVTYSLQINDPLYSLQWHLDGDVSKGAVAGSDINVETAWNPNNGPAAQGIPQVRVAIQDECVEKWHEDLLPNWATGRDYDQIPYDDDPSPDGGQRHGTSCAGVAVAKGNSLGVRGACPECGLIGVKFFGATISEQADSYLFCMDPNNDGDHSDGAAIMSNSWGYADGAFLPSDVEAAINTAALTGRNGKGCLILFAAANSDHTVNGVSALAQMPTVVCIGGTNSNGRHTEFSDVGPEVALTAPTNDRGDDGVRFPWLNITTVDNTGESGYNGLTDLNYTNQFGGTSSATPLAAGVLGLILSQDPNMTAEETLAIAAHTAVAIDPPYGRFDPTTGHSHRLGYGKVDAGAAVTATLAGLRWPGRIKNLGSFRCGKQHQFDLVATGRQLRRLTDRSQPHTVRLAPDGWRDVHGRPGSRARSHSHRLQRVGLVPRSAGWTAHTSTLSIHAATTISMAMVPKTTSSVMRLPSSTTTAKSPIQAGKPAGQATTGHAADPRRPMASLDRLSSAAVPYPEPAAAERSTETIAGAPTWPVATTALLTPGCKHH
jgi:subtilisin family serine protease